MSGVEFGQEVKERVGHWGWDIGVDGQRDDAFEVSKLSWQRSKCLQHAVHVTERAAEVDHAWILVSRIYWGRVRTASCSAIADGTGACAGQRWQAGEAWDGGCQPGGEKTAHDDGEGEDEGGDDVGEERGRVMGRDHGAWRAVPMVQDGESGVMDGDGMRW